MQPKTHLRAQHCLRFVLTVRAFLIPFAMLGLFAGAFLSSAYAQRTDTEKTTPQSTATDEVVEMSPFVVSESTDVGYAATSSLAGTRLKTDLKDIASQIDVFTPEFLADIAADNMVEAVAYSTNTADWREQALSSTDAIGGVNEVRARGFDQSTSSSDFFGTFLLSDFYNTERLTIANGPQSILFGLGNAGGVMDLTTKRAAMKNFTTLEMRVDSNGSVRASLDENVHLVRNKLALRVAALYADGQSFMKGGGTLQRRVFATATWRPFSGATIRGLTEFVQQYASPPANFISYDFVSPWVAAGRPLYDNSKGNAAIAANDPLFAKNGLPAEVISYGNNAIGNGLSQIIWNGSALTKGPQQQPGVLDTREGALLDSSIFPTDIEARANSRENDISGKLYRIFYEQKITADFYMEIAGSYEERHDYSGGAFNNGEAIYIRGDPNRYMPGGTETSPVLTVNPNVGRLYIESLPNGTERTFKTYEARLTASYGFDFARKIGPRFAWLGRYNLAGLASYRVDQTGNQENRAYIVGEPAFVKGDKLNNSRYLRTRYYLDVPNGQVLTEPIPGAPVQGPWRGIHSSGIPYTAYLFNDPEGSAYVADGTKNEIQTTMFSIQGFWWKNRINVFFGWRSDSIDSYKLRDEDRQRMDYTAAGDRLGLYKRLTWTQFSDTPSTTNTGITRTLGAVVRPFEWISAFYSKSENTALPPGKFDPWNNPLPGTYSDGYDFGVRISLLRDKLGARFNFYEENQNAFASGIAQPIKDYAANVERRLRGPDRPEGIGEVPVDGFDPVGRAGTYLAVANKRAKGVDFTIIGRPLRGWDIRLAVGRQHTFITNRSLAFREWVKARVPVWKDAGGLGWENVTMSDSNPQTLENYYNTVILREITSLEMVTGQDRFRQRRWRASLFTNYRFQSGALKGLYIGGGARWLDKAMIGWPLITIPGMDLTTEDVKHPYYTDPLFYIDANAGYTFARRIGSRACKITLQVNVRNLLNDDDYEVLRASYAGTPLVAGRTAPRQVIVTLRFAF